MSNSCSSAVTRRGIFSVSLSGLLWGTIGVAAQQIYNGSEISPLTIGFSRLAIAFPAVALGCVLVVQRENLKARARDYGLMALIGGMLAIYQVAYFSAVHHAGVMIPTLIALCVAPVLVALGAGVFLGERITLSTMLSLGCAVLGTALLVGFPGDRLTPSALIGGVGLSLLAALGYALMVLLGRGLAGRCHPMQTTAVSFAVGALLLAPVAPLDVIGTSSTNVVIWLAYLGLVPSALGYILFFAGVTLIQASTAAILTMLEPLVATVLAWALFSERVTMSTFLGGTLLMLAVANLYRSGR